MLSIERYLLAWTMSALCVGAVVITAVTYLVTLDEMNEIFDADLKNVAEALGTHHRAGIGPGDPERARLPVRSGYAEPAEIVTVTWTHDGQLVFSTDSRVAIPFRSEEAESASKIVVPMVVMVAFVTGPMVLALRRGLRPLDTAARDIATRSASSPTPIVVADVPREIRALVNSLNGLTARLPSRRSAAFSPMRRTRCARRARRRATRRWPNSAQASTVHSG
jgi:two-component system OmpR family sensor kinase